MSALVLRNILIKLKVHNKYINIALIIYTFLFPTAIIYSAVTLREVYMLCLVNLILLYIIKIFDKKKKIFIFKDTIFFLIYLTLLALLHRSNIIFAILFLSFVFTYFIIIKLNFKKSTVIVLATIAFIFIYNLGIVEIIFNNIKSYQQGHFHLTTFRAAYYSKSEITSLEFSLISFLSHVLNNIFNYFLQPTFIRINSYQDVILLLENLLRALILILIFLKLIKKVKINHLFNIFLVMFFLSELPYSQATVNWGTLLDIMFKFLDY